MSANDESIFILDEKSPNEFLGTVRPLASFDIPRIFEEKKQRERSKKKKKGAIRKEPEEVTAHKMSLEELANNYQTDINSRNAKESKGLTKIEAAARLQRDGPNLMTPSKGVPAWRKFLNQFLGFFPLLLEAGACLCLIGYALDTSAPDNLYLGVILWFVVIITAVFSFFQEAKSGNIMEGFRKMTPDICRVIRDGTILQTEASQLVTGDLVLVKAGDKVPADLRIIDCNNLKVNNSALTGESDLQLRSVHTTEEIYLEAHNLAFFTTLAEEGEAMGLVFRTGDRTEIGNIANLASNVLNEPTPLRKEIERFIKIISVVAIVIGLIFFIVGFIVGLNWLPNVVFLIGIIVANVPEGLLPTVTVALTLTAKRLAHRKVLVKNLEAVETLGSCSTIASDKTGTLTQNRMTVVHVSYDEQLFTVDGIAGSADLGSSSFQALQRIGALCNRAVFDPTPENMEKPILSRKTIGDASESAIMKLCETIKRVDQFREENPKIYEVPFNSVNKWQLSVHHNSETKKCFIVMKGAPERILTICNRILVNGEEREITEKNQTVFEKNYETLAKIGERVLGFAHYELGPLFTPDFPYDLEESNFPTKDFVFIGLMGLIDPPRDEVPNAVAKCKQAGIRVIMVTGDHPLTAESIARQVGILEGQTVEDIAKERKCNVKDVDPKSAPAVIIKGHDIPNLTDEDWDNILSKREIVFARTSPEQKLQIVENCQKRGEIVAVTGDGVNDSPALKKADLGCAMGSGSDVSKDAADIILLDDNFASIVAGIEEGRIIFDNLKKSIAYTLSSNSAELVPFLFFVVFQMPLALSAVLILCIDLGTDMIPAISLAYERAESDIMKRPPRNPQKDRLVTLRLAVYSYLWLGTIQAIAGYVCYFVTLNDYGISPSESAWISLDYFRRTSDDFMGYTASEQLRILSEAQTSFFVGVVVTRIGCVIACKTRKLSLFLQSFSNKAFFVGILIEISLALLLSYVPIFNTVFNTQPVSWKIWVIGLPFWAFVLTSDEIRKLIIRRYPKGKFSRLVFW